MRVPTEHFADMTLVSDDPDDPDDHYEHDDYDEHEDHDDHDEDHDVFVINKLAGLKATLVRNYNRLTDLLTGVNCRATSVTEKSSDEKSKCDNILCND